MVLAGFGMVVGNLLGGKLSDKYTPGRVAASTQFILFMALLGIFFVAHINWLTALLMCLCTAGLFAVSSPQQISIIHFAKEASYWEQPVYKWLSISAMPSVRISEVYPCKPDWDINIPP